MTQLDALALADSLRKRLVDFNVDDAFVRDERLSAICRRLWAGAPEDGGLLGHLWVEGAFPSQASTASLESLTHEGAFDAELAEHLNRAEAVPSARSLYTHQERAIRAARETAAGGGRPSLVVTAGTGAGKTESFLLPILNDLVTHPRRGQGVRCLILYPMNALVNDQVDRLYGWLQGQDRVTLFQFTGDTPEDRRRADAAGIPKWDPCRLRTRQHARGLESADGRPVEPSDRGPVPDIVITNYSMLEYMLCRPQDTVFFGPALRSIVLDEAHLYTGTLAAEITLLLRRLLIRCGLESRDVLQVATSATLGTGDESELAEFAGTLFSKDAASVRTIVGEPAALRLAPVAPPATPTEPADILALEPLEDPLVIASDDGTLSLADDEAACSRLRRWLPKVTSEAQALVSPAERRPAALLASVLSASPVLHRLAETLWTRRRLALSELTTIIWGRCDAKSIRATILVLQLAASSRTRAADYPLIPHRLHLLVRPSDGLTACLSESCSGPDDRRLAPVGTVLAGIQEHCPFCDGATLALFRCSNCGEWLLAGEPDGEFLRPTLTRAARTRLFTTRPDPDGDVLTIRPSDASVSGVGALGLRVVSRESCPSCEADKDDIEPFAYASSLAVSIVAETILASMPAFPSRLQPWLPARGRRLLAFSDSRTEAARLGPRLTRQHETQLVRAAIARMVEERPVADADYMASVHDELRDVERRLTSEAQAPSARQRHERRRAELTEELMEATAGGSMASWAGALEVDPVLAEILDMHAAESHQASKWSQTTWEQNRRSLAGRSNGILARELASPIRRAASAETLGLVEVTYPGLDTVTGPAGFIGQVASADARRALADGMA